MREHIANVTQRYFFGAGVPAGADGWLREICELLLWFSSAKKGGPAARGEMADALDLKSNGRKAVRVRVPPRRWLSGVRDGICSSDGLRFEGKGAIFLWNEPGFLC